MALQAAVYQHHQHQTLFAQNNNNGNFDSLYPFLLENCASSSSSSIDYLLDNNTQSSSQTIDDWHYNFAITGITDGNFWDNCNYWDYSYPCVDSLDEHQQHQQWPANPSPKSPSPEAEEYGGAPTEVDRPKRRRRARAKKNKEEIENQRMTHIAVERNRRKQMNDYLSVLRSLMPDSYVQRGDQASIIGGAINFVKELEQNLQCLSAQKQINDQNATNTGGIGSAPPLPFGEFFSFPQYSGTSSGGGGSGFGFGADDEQVIQSAMSQCLDGGSSGGGGGGVAADVEVTMVESHALLKIRTRRPPKQLSKLVRGLQGLRLTILHLNVTKLDGVALYSFSVKVEEESKLSSVDEIAGAVHELLGRIQDEAGGYF